MILSKHQNQHLDQTTKFKLKALKRNTKLEKLN